MNQGFPQPGKQLKIINKLNGMAITVSEGWYSTKPGAAVVDRPDFPQTQNFKLTQKGNSEIYLIETSLCDLVLSPKSGWGDMVYTETKFDKYSKQTSLFWRILPYEAVMYNEKSKQNLPFEYVPVHNNKEGCKCGSGEQKPKPEPYIKLGYEFESGNHLNYQYDDAKYREWLIASSMDKHQSQIQGEINDIDIPAPQRFPVKEKNNRHPLDRDNSGWFFIQNVKFNLVLEIQGGIDEPGMNVVLNNLNGNRNQLWRFV